jgi:hypothetical protein
MVDLKESVRKAMAVPRGGRQVCLVCGRGLGSKESSVRLRGGAFVHSSCATYERRRTGAERPA